jgi:Zn-dependent M16 (insulinase) family peptidase
LFKLISRFFSGTPFSKLRSVSFQNFGVLYFKSEIMMNRKYGSRFSALLFMISLVLTQSPEGFAQANGGNPYAALTKGQVLNGFRTDAVYLDATDKPIGGRFVHLRTGFTLDLLQIQSVPQAFIYANTFTVSDMGEPHTQEHLLIGKGNKGRNINVLENMSLTQSNASTYQTFTNYQFNTAGGAESFYAVFNEYMTVLLHPDYTEEEVRREVRNWGVTENPDKTLRLEEKGSVYNEMTSSMNNPDYRLYESSLRMIYGDAHPLSFNAGGDPDGIRKMTPDDIKRYHDANYHLGNMGAVVSVPKDMTPDAVLTRLDGIFAKAEPSNEKHDYMSVAKLPVPKSAELGTIRMIEYPSQNAEQPSSIFFSYPATLKLNLTEKLLLDNFLSVFAGDANTNLYKKFIDSTTRELDTGAQGMYSYVEDSPGAPIWLVLSDVPATNLNPEKAALIRQKIVEEFARVAAFKDGSPELKEFNDRFRNSLTAYRRGLSKFVNTPPGFGFRNGGNGYGWLWQTRYLNEESDFRKSVTLKPQIEQAESLLASGENFWRDYLPKWKLTETKPYVAVGHANPKLTQQEQAERKARADAQTDELKKKYSVADGQEAIRRYKADYDATTAELDKLSKNSDAKFIENPPLTLDDQIDYKETSVGNVKLGTATFDNMTGATTGIALNLDTIPEKDLVYLSSLPDLLRGVGVIKDGKAISYDEMSEMLRKEILGLEIEFTGSPVTHRYELTARGSGNDAAESERAVAWMKLVLENPNWRVENLPRIRDVVDQQLSGLRRRIQGSEESWVNNPSDSYRNQDSPLYLTAFSFLTQTHNAQRLRWMLKSAGDAENSKAIDSYLAKLAGAKGTRDEVKSMLTAMGGDKSQTVAANLKPLVDEMGQLPKTAQALAGDAASDLGQTLGDLPDSSLAPDWAYLCNEIRHDLAQPPEKTLADLENVRRQIVNSRRARMFYIGSSANRQKLGPAYQTLLAGFDASSAPKANYGSERRVEARLMARNASAAKPVYVGLMAPNMSGGVMINSARLTSYAQTDRDSILNFLASKLYSGGGAHSVFTKTISAGLAYSNGISSSAGTGLMGYYAERTPELPQTLRFAIGEVKRPMDEPLAEYVIALSFSSRASAPYETRGEAMASNMADGITPEVVSRFRRAILDVRKMPDLSAELYRRKDKVYERVFPGYGMKGRDVVDRNFFVIGAEKQMTAYEAYLKSVEGAETELYRLYPRDFWLTMK